MKKHILIFNTTEAGTYEAELHMDASASMLARCEALITCPGFEHVESVPLVIYEVGKTYVFDFDDIDYTVERYMRDTLGFRKCDRCGAWIAPQEVRQHPECYHGNNTRYCVACNAQAQANAPHTLGVAHYHGTSADLRFLQADGETMTADNFKGYGIEMEFDSNRRTHWRSSSARNAVLEFDCTDRFWDLNGKRGHKNSHFRMERDGSLSSGFEFISQCMSSKYMKAFDWSVLTEQMRFLGCDDSLPTSGFHVHISKAIFGDTAQEQYENYCKMLRILEVYESDFKTVSGRNTERRDAFYYCSFMSNEQIKSAEEAVKSERINGVGQMYHGSQGCAFIASGKTFELRIFKSTSDPERIKHTMALVAGLCENIRSVRYEKIFCMGKIFRLVPAETMKYWRSKGAFLRSVADTAKGMASPFATTEASRAQAQAEADAEARRQAREAEREARRNATAQRLQAIGAC